jgi:hypothetical protein
VERTAAAKPNNGCKPRKPGPLSWDELQAALMPRARRGRPLRRAGGELDRLAAKLDAIVVVGSKRTLRLNAQQQKEVQSALDAYPAVLPLIEQAAQRGAYRPEYNVGADAPDLGPSTEIRNACRVLRFRLFLSLASGQRNGAMAAAVDQLRIAGKLRAVSMLLPDYLTGLYQESLAVDSAAAILHTGPLSQRAHRELDSVLTPADDNASPRRALQGQRIFGRATIRGYASDGGWFLRWFALEQEIHFLDLLAARIADAERPYPDVRAQRAPATAPGIFSTSSFADSIRPTLDAAFDTQASVSAARCRLRLLNAIVGAVCRPQRRADRRRTRPAAGTFVDRSPVARFDSVRHGWLIYSAGPDLQDDGGSLADGRDRRPDSRLSRKTADAAAIE